MTQRRFLQVLTLLSLSTLTLGAAGCSQGHSPTEPESLSASSATKSLAASPGKRHGADDPAGDDSGGNNHGGTQGPGIDDPAGDDHGGTQGPGTDDPAGDDHGNHGGRGGQQQRPPRGAGELEGTVTTVDPAAGTLTLAGGKKIAVDGQTQWNRRGDLFSLQAVADAVAAAKPTRAEARGTRRADGVLLAQTIKAEIGTR
jgi:hypothetical protein